MLKLTPDLIRRRVMDITLSDLDEMHLEGLFLDVDNTLASHGHPDPTKGVVEWIALLKENGFKLMLISNNAPARVRPFADKLKIPYIADAYKPLRFKIRRAAKEMGLPCDKIAIVGDQIFTDVLGAHRSGMKAILVERIDTAESFSFRLRRRVETRVIKNYHSEKKKNSSEET